MLQRLIGKPATKEAVKLFHDGAIALAQLEHNGIKIDRRYLEKKIIETDKRTKELKAKLQKDPIYKKTWQKRFGHKTDIANRNQLGVVLFEEMGYEYPTHLLSHRDVEEAEASKVKRRKCSEAILSSIDLPFVRDFIEMQGLAKDSDTFLKGILKELPADDCLRSFYNLNIPISFRSSSDTPDFQNFPTRDPASGKLIRTAFIPRKGRVLVEIDMKGAEVRVGYCHHKDPTMRKYLLDETTDMHRDMASQCYMIPADQVSKQARYSAKNQFVFAEFYGSYYLDCAKAMWDFAKKMKLATVDGVPLFEALAKKGIKELGACIPSQKPVRGTFEYHIQEVEKDFWGRRFKTYAAWKDSWYKQYLKVGYFQMKTGFVVAGSFNKKQVVNFPIQGASFHCLLWALVELQKWLNRGKMRSLIVGQIHDSILLDCTEEELEEVIAMAVYIMTDKLPQTWKWICIPMEVEVETSKTNWHEKKEYKIAA